MTSGRGGLRPPTTATSPFHLSSRRRTLEVRPPGPRTLTPVRLGRPPHSLSGPPALAPRQSSIFARRPYSKPALSRIPFRISIKGLDSQAHFNQTVR